MLKINTKPIDWLIRILIYLSVFLIPVIFWTDFHTIFTVPKLLAFRSLTSIIVILLMVKFYVNNQFSYRLHKIYPVLFIVALAAILTSFVTLNTITSLYGQYGRFTGLFTTLNFLLWPVIIIYGLNIKDRINILRLSVITASLISIYGLFQFFDFFGWNVFEFNWTDSPQNRIFATAGHANHLGAYLAINLIFIIYLIREAKNKIGTQILYALVFALNFAVLIQTASRGAVLAFLGAILILIIIHFSINYKKSLHFFLQHIITFALVLGTLIVAISASWPTLQQLPLVERTAFNLEYLEQGKSYERLSFWVSSWDMFLQNPLLGTGLATFRDAFSTYRRPDFYVHGPGNAQYIIVPEAAHNEYLNILATQGIIGFAAYLLLLTTMIFFVGHQLRTKNNQNITLAIVGGLLVYLIQTFFSFGEILNLYIFYTLIGLMAIPESGALQYWRFRGVAKQFVTFVVLILITLFITDGVYLLGKSDYQLKKAQIAAANYNFSQAEKHYLQAIKAYPIEYSMYQKLADLSLRIAVLSEESQVKQEYLNRAVFNYQNAIQLNPNYSSTWHNLALTYIYNYRQTNDSKFLKLAQEAFELSIQNSPNNPRYYYEYARKLHSDFDDKPAAIDYLNQALQINPDYQEPQDYLNFLRDNHPELF